MTLDEFRRVDLRVGKVRSAEGVRGSKKLVKLIVDIGGDERQIVAGIGNAYEPESLVGKEIVIAANLEPRRFTFQSGSEKVELESEGMLLAASDEEGKPVLLVPEKEVEPGVQIT